MWLIRTDTFKLKYVIKPSSTSYAILSHTWTSDEITFQQITDLETARNLPGFAKIEKTCELARNHGLEYAWVDTCCIDKTSSVELLEAINSMYEWYQNAKICFVYLPDLAYDEDNPEAEALHDRLRDCRWWYRGWTLQELVAPESVSFFDSSWHQIGDKATNLLEIISSITDIDSDVLENVTNPSSVPIGIRMRWAAKRKTTRPEDIAYCLLGIFGINMPLLYGEGDKAFKRLQEEISKQSNDMSLFAWVARPDTEPSARHRSRGIFALHPSEFVSLPDVYVPHDALSREFTIANKGVKFDDVELIRANGEMLIFPLNPMVCHGMYGLGIYIAQTLNGYVRSVPTVLARITMDMRENTPAHCVYLVKHICHTFPLILTFPERSKDTLGVDIKVTAHVRPSGTHMVELVSVMPRDAFDYGTKVFLTGSQGFMGLLHFRVLGQDILIAALLDFSNKTPQPQYGISDTRSSDIQSTDILSGFENNLDKLWKSSSFRRGLLASVLSTTDLQLGGESTVSLGRLTATSRSSVGDTGFVLLVKFEHDSMRKRNELIDDLRRLRRVETLPDDNSSNHS